jgi:hypothetical protein
MLAICIDYFNKRGQIELEEGGDEPNTADYLRFFDVNFLKNIDPDVLADLELVGHSLTVLLLSLLDACPLLDVWTWLKRRHERLTTPPSHLGLRQLDL